MSFLRRFALRPVRWLKNKALVKHGELLVYAGAAHGIPDTHQDKLNAGLLAFIRSKCGNTNLRKLKL